MNDNSTPKSETQTTDKQPTKRRKWLRYTLIALCSALLLIVVAAVVVVCFLGPIVERYVEENDMELVGRRLEMDDLEIKLLKGRAGANKIILYEEDQSTPFASIERLDVALKLGDVFDHHIHVTEATLVNPYLRVDQNGNVFNFDDLVLYIIAKYIMPVDDDDEEWQITIENITVEGGTLAYHDIEIDQRWELTAMSLHSPKIVLDDAMSTIDAHMQINHTATLDGVLELNCNNFDFRFDGTVGGFELGDTYKYWTPYLNISSVEGTAAADMLLDGNVMDIFAMNISGELSAEGFKIEDCRGGNLLSATTLSASIEELNIEHERYIFRTLYADGYATQMLLNEDCTTNFDDLFYGEPEVSVETTTKSLGDDMYDVRERVTITTSEDVAPLSGMTLRIGDLRLSGGELYFADMTMHKPFDYRLSNILIESHDFDLMAKNSLSLRAKLPKQGSAIVQWEGSLTDFYNQNLLAMLSNVDIGDFTPYVEHYTAFPVTSGNLTFRSQNVVTNGELSGVNNLGTHNFNVGKKDKSLDAEYNLPVKLGIFILTDNKQNISLDLPISGRIDSPEFSYRKIIMKAVGNVLLKIVASPFMWMTGDKQDAYKHIDLDLLEMGLTSENYAQLDKMADALKDDPGVKVRLTQRVNYNRARSRIADLNLKIAYYNSTQQNSDEKFDMLDFERIRTMRLSRLEVASFADSQLMARGINPAHLTAENKAIALYGDMVDGQLQELMAHRNRVMREYMEFQHSDIPSGAFSINEVVLDDMKRYVGKDRYTVTLVIDDEEVEIIPDDSAVDDVALDSYDAYALDEVSESDGVSDGDDAAEYDEEATDETDATSATGVEDEEFDDGTDIASPTDTESATIEPATTEAAASYTEQTDITNKANN